jgi:hypothetical protein
MYRWNTTKKIEGLVLESDTSLSERIGVLYNKSRVLLASLVSLYRTVFPPRFVATRKEEKTPNNTPLNPNSPVLASPMQLPVPPPPDGRLPC